MVRVGDGGGGGWEGSINNGFQLVYHTVQLTPQQHTTGQQTPPTASASQQGKKNLLVRLNTWRGGGGTTPILAPFTGIYSITNLSYL